MLHFIEGRSGSGKTARLRDMLEELAGSGENRLLYLIPEQSSFACETDFLRRLGPSASQNIRVTSFTRLYNYVMRETGADAGAPIDDSVRKILMSEALNACGDRLTIYEKQAAKPQFVATAIAAVKEFKQCGITPDMLRKSLDGQSGEMSAGTQDLHEKVRDLALIYDTYNALVERSGVDPYDNDMRLEKRIAETGFFRGWTIAVDDFSGFTAQQHKILALLIEQASDLYVSLCRDPDSDDELFYTVNRTRQRLLRSASDQGVKTASPVRLRECKRANNDALAILEERLYRRGSPSAADDEIAADIPCVTTVCAEDIYDECAYVASCINELTLSGKCRRRDIAIVFRKSDKYLGVLDKALEKCDIPYFMSKPVPVDNKPLMRLAKAALTAVISPNDERNLLTAAKTGLIGLPSHRIAALENYIFVWGLRGKDLYEPFTKPVEGFAESMSETEKKRLERINLTRKTLTEPFAKMRETLVGTTHTPHEIAGALYQCMIDLGVDERIKRQADRERKFSDEQVRLWSVFCNMLNKIVVSLGQRGMTVRRFLELFEMICSGEDISDIPQTRDQVIVGKADSIRFNEPYAVFIIGAVTGEFPHLPVEDGVFSDAERRLLISRELPLYDDLEDLCRQEQFLVYNAVSAPTDRLFVTYPSRELTGGAYEPSSIITDIERILPQYHRVVTSELPPIERVSSERTAFEMYAGMYGSSSPFAKALGKYLSEESFDYGERVEYLGIPIKNLGTVMRDKSAAQALFGKEKHLSASQIEKFYSCRFEYLMKYGLRVKERRKASLDALVYGNLMHYILENVIKAYIEKGERFEEDELSELLDKLLKQYIEEFLGGAGDKDDRFLFLYGRSKKRVRKVINNLMDELEQSGFKPAFAELTMGGDDGLPEYRIDDSEGGSIHIKGKIDRLDTMDDGDNTAFVRIIDYKTSDKTVSLSQVINGINLQMLLYLSAAVKNGSGLLKRSILLPAGVLYRVADIGSVDVELDKNGVDSKSLEEKSNKKLKADLRMKGIVINDDRVKNAIDSNKGAYTKSDEISPDDMGLIFDKIEKLVADMSLAMSNGELMPTPTEDLNVRRDSCKYCEYKQICRREAHDSKKRIPKEKNATVLSRLHKEYGIIDEGKEEKKNG